MTGMRKTIWSAVLLVMMFIGAALTVRAASPVSGDGYESAGRASDDGYEMLPDWIEWKERTIHTQFSWTDPGVPAGQDEPWLVTLSDRKVTVSGHDGEPLFETPDNLYVQDVCAADADRDGQRELVLLCWRKGRFDRIRPFWIREPEKKYRQHIYIYDWEDGGFRQRWMGSDILVDVAAWYADVINVFHLTDPEGKTSRWAWDGWGFSCLDEIEPSNRLTFAAAGDNLIHSSLLGEEKLRGSFDFLFDGVREEIREADVAILNQETPFVTDLSLAAGYPQFATPYTVGTAIRDAGFDIVSCGTNHALDQGIFGLWTTAAFFQENGILYTGIQGEDETADIPYRIYARHGIRTAVLNYTETTNGHRLPEEAPYALHLLSDEEKVRRDLKAAREDADLVLVLAHWGTEYEAEPDESQQRWCEVFLEEGADVVIGTHPHVLQPYELLTREDGHEMLVYWSLGNFISAQGRPECILGGLAEFTVVKEEDGVRITSFGLEPLVTHMEAGAYTTYLLSDYTEELAARNSADITLDALRGLLPDTPY